MTERAQPSTLPKGILNTPRSTPRFLAGFLLVGLLSSHAARAVVHDLLSIPLASTNSVIGDFRESDSVNSGGPCEAVSAQLAGESDPEDGTSTVITDAPVSTMGAPDDLFPEPSPRIVNVHLSGSTVTLIGTNGLPNAVYDVVSSTDLTLPVGPWAAMAILCHSLGGSFGVKIPRSPSEPTRYYSLSRNDSDGKGVHCLAALVV